MPLPPLVIATRRTAKHHLKKRLPEFFSQVDDSLFALADKAENNQLQNLYFDAMREVRLKKDAMNSAYRSQLDALFNESLGGSTVQHGTPEELGPLDQIGLVGDEQLEESLALTNMISSADMQYREALYALTTRLDYLIDEQEIHKDNNPLRPDVICHAFTAAVGELNSDLKIRLVIYKLFDKHVVQHLDDMYSAINADLVAAGVLPRIKTPAQRSAEKNATAQRSESDIIAEIASAMSQQESVEQSTENAPTGNLFASLQHMLSQQRSLPGDHGAPATGGIPAGGGVMNGAAPGGTAPLANGLTGADTSTGEARDSAAGIALYYAPQDIVSALSSLQGDNQLTALVQGRQGGEQPLNASLIKTSLTQAITQQAGDGGERQIGQADTDAIDIVSMLFDFILDDPHIADNIKALIARLQIPMLKIAIIDKEFFARKTHPARQLLNELAYAGAEDLEAENAEEQNPTLQMVEYVVERILNEFEDDPELFATLLGEFTRFVEEEHEANRLAEEMLEQARDTVADEIRQRVEGQNLPPFIHALLIDAWKDVLNHIYLRDGGGKGTAWETALKVADDLIWSVQPKLVVSERQSLVRVIPRVLNGLRDGLTLITYDHAITERIFDKLEELHLASLRGGVSAVQNLPADPENTPSINAPTENMPAVDSNETATEASDARDEADEFIEEIILASTQAMDWDGWDQLDSEYAELVKDMTLGTWVEFSDAETEKHSRGKLAWKCDFTGEYTFVDRKYKVVADLTFKKLLEEFDLGRAQVIDDVPLFDRALDSVISSIKRAMEGKGETREETPLH